MAAIQKVTVAYDDGSEQVIDATTNPVDVTLTGVDVQMSDGSLKKFVPAQ